ncbi:MAG: TrkA family potassium uptake protein [Ruminococcaceae bacterium]|nr:TrkA family potassium uptake protein [Oscillospiraceae bacterium]
MKSFLIIGMGSLGNHLCDELSKNNCEIMIADIDPAKVENVNSAVVTARVCDCTNRGVLETLGVEDFDVCFVCIEDYFQACLEITDLLKELGAKKIYSTANRQIEEKFLLRSGADRIIYPERDICRRIASVECAQHIFDYINIADDYSIFEIEPLKKWIGKTVMELNFRNKYNLNIIAYKKNGQIVPFFNANYVFNENEHLLVLGNTKDIEKIVK